MIAILKTLRFLTVAAILTVPAVRLQAQALDLPDYGAFETDDSLRINPDIVYEAAGTDVPIPSFINRSANRIKLNGADWSALRAKTASPDSTVSVVHIGDSHIQAEIGTSVTRDLLQLRFGNAGRGLVAPLRLSGTNQPHDYSFRSTRTWRADKFMKGPWRNEMGFNGMSITLQGRNGDVILSTAETDDQYNPFNHITLYHTGAMTVAGITDDMGISCPAEIVTAPGVTELLLFTPRAQVKVDFVTDGEPFTLFGATLSTDRPGVIYHAIGNNGATYSAYNRLPSVGTGVSSLHPDLIIISLGANEAFGKLDLAAFRASVTKLIATLRRENPSAQLLIVTPMECQRRRRVRRRTSYSVNANILPLRNELLRIAEKEHVAVYDCYAVAGGAGASSKWLSAALYGKDRVHHTASGYRLAGRLLYDALINQLEEK